MHDKQPRRIEENQDKNIYAIFKIFYKEFIIFIHTEFNKTFYALKFVSKRLLNAVYLL